MIKVATLDKYTIYLVTYDGDPMIWLGEGEAYHPLNAVINLVNSSKWGESDEDHTFVVQDSTGKRSLISAHKGWVVDFVPISEQERYELNRHDYTED